jgi:hypothetical protein
MIDTLLVPEKTVVHEKGDGPTLDISAAAGKIFLLTLRITHIIEQESLDVSVWGSADGTNFGTKALAGFPQKFYTGEHPLLLDVSGQPEVKFLRAHWDVNRWGRGAEPPMFEFQIAVKEVSREILQEVTANR